MDTTNKVLMVKEIDVSTDVSTQEVSDILNNKIEFQSVDLINWQEFPYEPTVRFKIAHNNDQIWLKFYVQEEHILAQRTETNSATHKDSCVEFFIDPQQNGNYYNFEFNCIGTTHLAYGPNRGNRQFIDPHLIENKIQIESSLGNLPFEERTGEYSWELTIIIPVEVFVHEDGLKLKGLKANANFYKCGDQTSKPHYLSWNPVGTERPDFHQPGYFGNLMFE
ncbi:hypothetical protein FB2170_04545 [Maribacter sp. HTCC2170]|nr:hypothetical protein FB2170_04545 [Maribacter sp. HTCC2170]